MGRGIAENTGNGTVGLNVEDVVCTETTVVLGDSGGVS